MSNEIEIDGVKTLNRRTTTKELIRNIKSAKYVLVYNFSLWYFIVRKKEAIECVNSAQRIFDKMESGPGLIEWKKDYQGNLFIK